MAPRCHVAGGSRGGEAVDFKMKGWFDFTRDSGCIAVWKGVSN